MILCLSNDYAIKVIGSFYVNMALEDMLIESGTSFQKAFLPEVIPPFVPPEGGIITVIKTVSYMILFKSPPSGGVGGEMEELDNYFI